MARVRTALGLLAFAAPIVAACGVTLEGQVTPDVGAEAGAPDGALTMPPQGDGAPPTGGLTGCDAIAVVPSELFDFGKVPVGDDANGHIRLTNRSSSPIDVTIDDLGEPFQRIGERARTLLPDVESGVDVRYAPTAAGSATTTLRMAWAGCTARAINLAGATLADGEVGVSPATLTLAPTPCGGTATPGTITLKSAKGGTWSATVLSPFVFLPGQQSASGNVPGTVDVGTGLLGKSMPATYGSDIDFAFGPSPSTATVHVSVDVIGAVIGASPAAVTLGPDGTGSVQITNTGSALAKIQLSPLVMGVVTLTPNVFDLAAKSAQKVDIVWPPNGQSWRFTFLKVKTRVTSGAWCGGEDDGDFTVNQPQ